MCGGTLRPRMAMICRKQGFISTYIITYIITCINIFDNTVALYMAWCRHGRIITRSWPWYMTPYGVTLVGSSAKGYEASVFTWFSVHGFFANSHVCNTNIYLDYQDKIELNWIIPIYHQTKALKICRLRIYRRLNQPSPFMPKAQNIPYQWPALYILWIQEKMVDIISANQKFSDIYCAVMSPAFTRNRQSHRKILQTYFAELLPQGMQATTYYAGPLCEPAWKKRLPNQLIHACEPDMSFESSFGI